MTSDEVDELEAPRRRFTAARGGGDVEGARSLVDAGHETPAGRWAEREAPPVRGRGGDRDHEYVVGGLQVRVLDGREDALDAAAERISRVAVEDGDGGRADAVAHRKEPAERECEAP